MSIIGLVSAAELNRVVDVRSGPVRLADDGLVLSLKLAEVLGALQRMGLNPPPALLVKPEDALSSVRSAILLGAVVPELRQQTEVLLADLKELSRVTASIEAERTRLMATVEEQVGEKKRLSLLLDEKKKLQDEQETALAGERAKAAELAEKAGSLKELIASIQTEIEDVHTA